MSGALVPPVLSSPLSPELYLEVATFSRQGYLVVEDAIRPEQIEVLRAAFDGLQAKEPSEFKSAVLEQDAQFAVVLDPPKVMLRIRAILGDCVQLSSTTARMTKLDTPDQAWHRDGPWPIDTRATPYGTMPGEITVSYFLDEITPEMGGLVILPGSQRAPFGPPEGHPRFAEEVHLFGRPGQAILFDGWVFHRGAANRSNKTRRVVMICYNNAWMRTRDEMKGPVTSRLRREASAERKLLLGAGAHLEEPLDQRA